MSAEKTWWYSSLSSDSFKVGSSFLIALKTSALTVFWLFCPKVGEWVWFTIKRLFISCFSSVPALKYAMIAFRCAIYLRSRLQIQATSDVPWALRSLLNNFFTWNLSEICNEMRESSRFEKRWLNLLVWPQEQLSHLLSIGQICSTNDHYWLGLSCFLEAHHKRPSAVEFILCTTKNDVAKVKSKNIAGKRCCLVKATRHQNIKIKRPTIARLEMQNNC